MIIRLIDAAGDWTFGKGNSNYASDELAVEQNLRTRLLSWLGDCFFALADGVDWRGRLDVGQQNALLEEIRSIILKTEGVVGVTRLEGIYDPRTRHFKLTYDIQTIFSPSFTRAILQTFGS